MWDICVKGSMNGPTRTRLKEAYKKLRKMGYVCRLNLPRYHPIVCDDNSPYIYNNIPAQQRKYGSHRNGYFYFRGDIDLIYDILISAGVQMYEVSIDKSYFRILPVSWSHM